MNDADSGEQFTVDADLVAALRAHIGPGERAAGLLLDAGEILRTADQWNQPYEAAQSLCRNALEAILEHLTNKKDIAPGIQAANAQIIAVAESLASSVTAGRPFSQSEVDGLVAARQALLAARADKGGFRVRQVLQLVQRRTGRIPKEAEYEAARETWSEHYDDASGVLHGGSSTAQEAIDLFEAVIAAARDVFLPFEAVHEEFEAIALEEAPSPEQIGQVSNTTSPLVIEYVFRSATSPVWLKELPELRLRPQGSSWAAAPYLYRLANSGTNREAAAGWLHAHLDDFHTAGLAALRTAVAIAGLTGKHAEKLMQDVAADERADHLVLDNIAAWVVDRPSGERTGTWVRTAQTLLSNHDFTDSEAWAADQVLAAAAAEGRNAGLALSLRMAAADALSTYLRAPDGQSPSGALDGVGDLRAPAGAGPFARDLARTCLDFAYDDAAHGVPLPQRLRPLHRKLPAGSDLARLTAVHLLETGIAAHNDDWWAAALDILPAALSQVPRADVVAFVAHLFSDEVKDRPDGLADELSSILGTPPTAAMVDQGLDDMRQGQQMPASWSTVWALADAVPQHVIEPWRPALDGIKAFLAERQAAWHATSATAPTLPGLVGVFEADGPVAAARELAASLTDQDLLDARTAADSLISQLVGRDPAAWSQAPDAVCAALGHPGLQTAYLVALSRSLIAHAPSIDDGALNRCIDTALRVAEDTDGIADEHIDELQAAACKMIRTALRHDMTLEREDTIVTWLDQMVTNWPAEDLDAELVQHWQWPARGQALETFIEWGAHTPNGHLAEAVGQRLDVLLSVTDHHLAHAVIGAKLTTLVMADAAWVQERGPRVLSLDAVTRPARVWLRTGFSDPVVLGMLDTEGVARVLRETTDTKESHQVAVCLLTDTTVLGDLPRFLEVVAGGECGTGPAAVSKLLTQVAVALPRIGRWKGLEPFSTNAAAVWRAALDASLPPEGLAGLGRFAYSQLPISTWVELMEETVTRTAHLENPRKIVDRAARAGEPLVAARLCTTLLHDVDRESIDCRELQTAGLQLLHRHSLWPSTEADGLEAELVRSGLAEASKVRPTNLAPFTPTSPSTLSS